MEPETGVMAKSVADVEQRWLSGVGLAAALTVMGLYFGLILVPEGWPAFGATGVFFVFMLSIPFAVLGLLSLAVWGVVGIIAARRRGSSVGKLHRTLVVLPLAGVVIFGSAIVLARVIWGTLPTGSHVLEFAPPVWRDHSSFEFVRGDITPRQKMLGSLVKRFGPAQDRAELEALLGPSLETPYFAQTGRDLIYVLGPERSFPESTPNGFSFGSMTLVTLSDMRSTRTRVGLASGAREPHRCSTRRIDRPRPFVRAASVRHGRVC